MAWSVKSIILGIALIMVASVDAETTRNLDNIEREVRLLKAYRLKYPREIFNYCVERWGVFSTSLGGCMLAQTRIKARIFRDAQQKLGLRSSVERIYRECLDYYPARSLGRVGNCVHGRVLLREILQDYAVEAEIYRRCDFKWRKHGFRAIDNCSLHEAIYYRDNGRYYED